MASRWGRCPCVWSGKPVAQSSAAPELCGGTERTYTYNPTDSKHHMVRQYFVSRSGRAGARYFVRLWRVEPVGAKKRLSPCKTLFCCLLFLVVSYLE